MGDDAEYYMEQLAEAKSYDDMCERASLAEKQKSLFCWVNGEEEDLWWSWEPMTSVHGVFFNLYDARKIGSDYFLSCLLPGEEYEDEEDDGYDGIFRESEAECEVKVIDGLEFAVVDKDSEASSEVLILSQKDVAPLKEEAIRQKSCAKNLKEQMISEMLEEMCSFMDSNRKYTSFVFAREI